MRTRSEPSPSGRLGLIRDLVVHTFGQLGMDNEECSEQPLVCNGHVLGWRFTFTDAQAVWFVAEDQVKFYRKDRTLLKVVRLYDGSSKRAA